MSAVPKWCYNYKYLVHTLMPFMSRFLSVEGSREKIEDFL